MEIKSKVWIEKDGKLIFGKGKSDLLKAIGQAGSISGASKKMNISFRHGWGYITAIEKRLGVKLLEKSKGGKDKGGSSLTPLAKDLIKKYDKLEKLVDEFVDRKFREIFGEWRQK
ncbi:MAG: hypothetical protein AUJ85_05115 [Elusimicrobia bacterium CG1_02_37_114]|nr:MAG: hypothetical protein AUJ85_05115 [Elusimicrobia bacterium CG1_02_37_114]PIV53753.1 MAG: hypothetical protein COS17_02280 [Elusimicrobia bacterium CG02_land_8_20_14_3_00_37_13]